VSVIECPPDISCGGSRQTMLAGSSAAAAGKPWCQSRSGARCGGHRVAAATTYADVRLIVGCESLPIDAPLCPVGKCETDCLCRESLLKRLQNLLLGSSGNTLADEDSEKEEL